MSPRIKEGVGIRQKVTGCGSKFCVGEVSIKQQKYPHLRIDINNRINTKYGHFNIPIIDKYCLNKKPLYCFISCPTRIICFVYSNTEKLFQER